MLENKVAAAIREEIHALTAEGPFTIARAMKVKRIAQASALILRSLSDSVADKAPDPKLPLFESLADTAESFAADEGALGPIAPAPFAETHATMIMREVIAAVPRFLAMQHSNPFELVRAIAHAEACGMADLATKLRKQLGVEKPEESTPPTSPFGLVASFDTHAEGETPLPALTRVDREPTLASDSENGTTDSPSAVAGSPCPMCGKDSVGFGEMHDSECRRQHEDALFKKTDISPLTEAQRAAFEADPRIPDSLKLRPIT